MAQENDFHLVIGNNKDTQLKFYAESSEELHFILEDVFENLEVGDCVEVHDGLKEVTKMVRD